MEKFLFFNILSLSKPVRNRFNQFFEPVHGKPFLNRFNRFFQKCQKFKKEYFCITRFKPVFNRFIIFNRLNNPKALCLFKKQIIPKKIIKTKMKIIETKIISFQFFASISTFFLFTSIPTFIETSVAL
jgi:hypothetical protein